MSDTVKAWIQDRRSVQVKATIGEWDKRGDLEWEGSLFGANGKSIGQTWGICWREDQDAIVDARNKFPKALAALSKVLELIEFMETDAENQLNAGHLHTSEVLLENAGDLRRAIKGEIINE